jgi:hypothetical protein
LEAIGHGIQPDYGIPDLGATFLAATGKRFFDREPKPRMLA